MSTPHLTLSNQIADICSWLTVPQAAAMAGISIAADGDRFCSPFRVDRTPNCTASETLFSDWSRSQHLDAVGVFAAARGIGTWDAVQELNARKRLEAPAVVPRPPARPLGVEIPPLKQDREKCRQLAEMRRVSVKAVEASVFNLRTVGFAIWRSLDCWLLTDSAGKIAEARRMDGKLFPAAGKLRERKAHTLYGSVKRHPVGIASAMKFPSDYPVMLVEGGGDYLAAVDVALHSRQERVPVAMLGASASISAEALPWFAGRDVVILAHPDQAGKDAGKRWRTQLKAVCSVRLLALEGGDLNDLVARDGAAAIAGGLGL
jgi:hypothetical protein